jgi:hypothetical protein
LFSKNFCAFPIDKLTCGSVPANRQRCIDAKSLLCKHSGSVTTIIEIKQWRNGWKVFECPGVEPVFLAKDQALSYAKGRASFRSREIRVLDSAGTVEETIIFSEGERKL